MNKVIDYLQIAIFDLSRSELILKMELLEKFGRLNESPRSNLFLGSRIKLEKAEENLSAARINLENTKDASIKLDIENSIIEITRGYNSLKSANDELKHDYKKISEIEK